MTVDRVTEARLREVGRLLRQAPPELRRQVVSDLRASAREVAAQQRAAARALVGQPGVPKDAARLAAREVRVDYITAGGRPRIAIRVRRSAQGRMPWNLNQGHWRHPLFGDRSRWYDQRINSPGWFDRTAARNRPRLAREANAALDRATELLARQINRAGSR